MKHSVLIIQRRLPHYRTALFDRLRKRLSENNIILSLAHGKPFAQEAQKSDEEILSWAQIMPCRYVRLGGRQAVFMSIPTGLIKVQDLIIMPHENSMIVNYLLMARRLATGRPKLAFFGHGRNFQAGESLEMRTWLKRTLIPVVDWWFAYTALSVKEIRAAGLGPERITCLNNAIDTSEQLLLKEQISREEKEALLERLGLRGGNCAIFLGSLYQHKRISFLLRAADELQRRMPDFELLIIGDGPLSGEVKKFVKLRSWAKWAGAQFGREKMLYTSLGKIMLNPGLVGLGILDSFSLGIPLITTDCGSHSPEIDYLESGRNGVMTADTFDAFVSASEDLLKDQMKLNGMKRRCLKDAERYTLDAMVDNFAGGIEAALGPTAKKAAAGEKPLRKYHVAVIWQRFLPYHSARLRQLLKTLAAKGHKLTAIEVASQDIAYGFPEVTNDIPKITCFPGQIYHQISASSIRRKLLEMLRQCSPDIVFAPATAFPEGMAALMYRMESGGRVVIMDDSWEMTDRRGAVTNMVKRLLHRLVDGAFVPAPSHMAYYANLNIPFDRTVFGVDVVDNDYYAAGTDKMRRQGDSERSKLGIPQHYFLFVGRFMKRKGIETLLDAFKEYRTRTAENDWNLVLVGDGPELETIKKQAKDTKGLYFAGRQMEDELLALYAFAAAFIAPSELDPWALVVNEAMASGLPVIVSRGCGSAQTLVHEGENGWTFEPGDSASLARLMEQMTSLAPERLKAMGNESRIIIAEWSLDRFCHGVMEALKLPRRNDAGLLSNLAVRLWKGRVSVN